MTMKQPKLDKKLKTNWIKALLSGDYKQGKICLKNEKGEYCCLGVLADICGKLGRSNQFDTEKASGKEHYLSTSLFSFAKENGLLERLKKNPYRDVEGLLAEMNDGNEEEGKKPFTFKQIAAWIRKNL